MNNQECAKIFADAIREFAKKENNIDNLESYLSNHFDVWMKKYASTPYDLAWELKQFAIMDI